MKANIHLWVDGRVMTVVPAIVHHKCETALVLEFYDDDAIPGDLFFFQMGTDLDHTPERWARPLWHEVHGKLIVSVGTEIG
jgi:hypothetical protein